MIDDVHATFPVARGTSPFPTPSFPILLNARFDPIFPWLERRRLRTMDGKPAVRKILRSIVPSFPIHTDSCKSYEIVSRDKKKKEKRRKKERKRIALQLPRSAKTRKKPRLGKKRRAPRFDFVVARREINHREIKVGHGFTEDISRRIAVPRSFQESNITFG